MNAKRYETCERGCEKIGVEKLLILQPLFIAEKFKREMQKRVKFPLTPKKCTLFRIMQHVQVSSVYCEIYKDCAL